MKVGFVLICMLIGQTLERLDETCFCLINEQRAKTRLAALVRHHALDKLAQGHAQAMATADKYGDAGNGHILNGKSFQDRIVGLEGSWKSLGENVGAAKHSDPGKAIVAAWMQSKGHRESVLNPSWMYTGMGAAKGKSGKWYFCQVFGQAK